MEGELPQDEGTPQEELEESSPLETDEDPEEPAADAGADSAEDAAREGG